MPARPGMSAWFLNLNRGKRSLAIDLKAPDGPGLPCCASPRTVDVLLYNIRPAAMGGSGCPTRRFPRSIPRWSMSARSASARDGHYSNLPAYDDLIQAATGMPWLYQFAGGQGAALRADADRRPA